ncbi:hypothetical protein ACFYYB_27140 [Streptomyces sp. NPDC002886]|uniref:hypothetical protein n=1 Tax=Streptomyces sp. NPDC002886 TaxID=3364667 RepID=UPI0036AC88F3
MGGTHNQRQDPDKGREREEQERMRRTGQDPVHAGAGERDWGKSPEELKRRREEDMRRGLAEDEMRDEER